MKYFFINVRIKSGEQIKELYTLMVYDDNFVKKVILDANDENGLIMKGDLLSLGPNYMVDGREVYLDKDGFPVLDDKTELSGII